MGDFVLIIELYVPLDSTVIATGVMVACTTRMVNYFDSENFVAITILGRGVF